MKKTDNFEIKLINTVKKFNMLSRNDRVLVGLSGGKDSVALLYSLKKLSAYFQIELVAYHLNHQIRGEQADSDENFSKAFCAALGVPFVSEKIDVLSLAETSDKGVESVARDVRYAEFKRVAREHSCNKIATAHTASDNSETVFISLLRNSNAKGIPPVRNDIIRPLIAHTTSEVLDYCKRNSLEYVNDCTNADDYYTRNYVRHNILPNVYKINANFDENTLSYSNIQRSHEALVLLETERYYESNLQPLRLDSLSELASNTAFHNVLFKVINDELTKQNLSLSYRQFDSLRSFILTADRGHRFLLNDKFSLLKGYEQLELVENNQAQTPYEFEIKLGENRIPDSDIVLFFEKELDYVSRNKENELKCAKVNKLTKNILIKYNIINSSLVARSRRTGDSYLCRGMTRIIKKYMTDEKIPAKLRSRIPIVCDDEGIIWVPGLGLADRINAYNGDGEIYSLSIAFKNDDD